MSSKPCHIKFTLTQTPPSSARITAIYVHTYYKLRRRCLDLRIRRRRGDVHTALKAEISLFMWFSFIRPAHDGCVHCNRICLRLCFGDVLSSFINWYDDVITVRLNFCPQLFRSCSVQLALLPLSPSMHFDWMCWVAVIVGGAHAI